MKRSKQASGAQPRTAKSTPGSANSKEPTSSPKPAAGPKVAGSKPGVVAPRPVKKGKPVRPPTLRYLDRLGRDAFDYAFDLGTEFSGGVAAVKLAGRWALISKQGSLRELAAAYAEVEALGEGRFLARRAPGVNAAELIDGHGDVLATGLTAVGRFEGGFARFHRDGRCERHSSFCLYEGDHWGVIAATGREAVPARFIACNDPRDGFVAVNEGSSLADPQWRFLGLGGARDLPGTYAAADQFGEGLAAVRTADGPAFVDLAGKVALQIPDWCENVRAFRGGVAVVESGYRTTSWYRLLCRDGSFLTPFDCAEAQWDGDVGVVRRGESRAGEAHGEGCVIVTADGSQVPLSVGRIGAGFHEGLMVGYRGDKASYFDRTGGLAFPGEFQFAKPFHEGLALARSWAEWRAR
jgi:hypothetical protein